MEELLYIIYGTHPKSRKLYSEAEKIINLIRDKGEINREELATNLGIDLNSPSGKKHFYNIISPMFNRILVSEHRGKAVYYRLSYDLFRVYIDGIRRKAKYYLLKNAETDKEEDS
jgi:hypothetical protein